MAKDKQGPKAQFWDIQQAKEKEPQKKWRRQLHEIIFEADTPAGKAFDVLLIISIILSVMAVLLDSVASIKERHGNLLYTIEWFFTILFSIEYILRLICIGRPILYAVSFFGLVDLLSIIPTYLSLFFPGSQYLLVIRILRVLRVFRVLKLVQFIEEYQLLIRAMRASLRKIIVFIFCVLSLVIIFGALMYMIEGEENGFTSIPRSIYWAIVTLTTVGYGDISPKTSSGQMLASLIMIMGYGIIAVPTGIMTAELTQISRTFTTQSCSECSAEGHDPDAQFCKYCGASL